MSRRLLIVNADDLGRSPGINQGILRAHEHGILTSASMMTRYPAAAQAAEYARSHQRLSVGLHLDLGEFVYDPKAYDWRVLYQVVAYEDTHAVTREIHDQLETFRSLVGRDPTHLDSHQHVHRKVPALTVMKELGDCLRIPLRQITPGIHYNGHFHGESYDGHDSVEDISVDALLQILESLPEGVTELACHPGFPDLDIPGIYHQQREIEVETLCDPRVREAIDRLDIRLTSFADLHP